MKENHFKLMITLRKIVDSSSTDISKLIRSHCRLKDNTIDYIIEIPLYTPIGENLIQITPIPIFVKKMYMLDANEELLIKKENELFIAEKCIKNKNNYFCNNLYTKTQKCIQKILKTQNNMQCMYHQIHNTTFILKIRNSDITIIASDEGKKLKINCNKFERTNIVLGVYRFKNNENCTINNQTFDNIK